MEGEQIGWTSLFAPLLDAVAALPWRRKKALEPSTSNRGKLNKGMEKMGRSLLHWCGACWGQRGCITVTSVLFVLADDHA